MKTNNNIIYADLSTYSLEKSIRFYEAVFGWKYYEYEGNYGAYLGNRLVAGLYETPEKFKQMRMPHFWMTYIQVDDVDATVAKARELGGIIELVMTIPDFGKLALIRDPQGAGFTVYEGDQLDDVRTADRANTLVWNELHISDATNIIPFYEGIFDWKFQGEQNGYYEIYNGKEQYISDALVIPNSYKGKYEYWVCTIGVSDLEETKRKILDHEGSIVVDEGERILFTDNSGEAFFYIREV